MVTTTKMNVCADAKETVRNILLENAQLRNLVLDVLAFWNLSVPLVELLMITCVIWNVPEMNLTTKDIVMLQRIKTL